MPRKSKSVTEKENFRLANQKLLLTYKTHLAKGTYIEWLTSKLKMDPEIIRLAHEKGDTDVPYEHTHVVVDFGYKVETTNARYFDYTPPEGGDPIHPHIKPLKHKKALKDALVYISKEDRENEDLKEREQGWQVTNVLSARTKIEAITENMKTYTDVNGICAIFDLKDSDFRKNKPDWSNWVPRPWQQWLLDTIQTKPDGRSIYWIYDKVGRKGKSILGDYLEDEYEDEVWMTDDLGNSRDAGTIIWNKLSSGWMGSTIIVDLTRCAEHHDRMYDYLEKLANGRITSQKYSGRTIKFDKCHIIVMSNFLPHITKMSEDRWKIVQLLDDFTHRDMTLSEVRKELGEIPEESPYRRENWPSKK